MSHSIPAELPLKPLAPKELIAEYKNQLKLAAEVLK
jgi:hypothetical protein